MIGRMGEIQRNGGDPKSESPEKREQTLFVLDFWKKLATSYFKDEKISVYDSNKKNMVLDHSTVEKTLNNVVDLSKEEVIKLKRTVANLEVVSFLDECEARAKICDHGPYKISDTESLVFREISHIYDGGVPHFPWSGTDVKAPYNNIAFAFRLKDVEINFDDFATLETIPQDFTDNITGVALFTRSGENVKNLDLTILDSFKDYSERANKELFLKFSKWDRKQRLIAGAYAYCYGYARYTNFVGITGDINWDLTEKTMNTYVPMFMESDFDPGIPRLFRSKSKKRREGPSLYLLPEA